MAKRLGWAIGGSVAVVISGLYLAFIWLAVVSHMDKPNLIGPTPEDKLAEWTEVCDERMHEGTSLQDVETYVQSLGFFGPESKDPWKQQSYYRHFRKENWVQYQIIDKDVLNWGLGEIDIEMTIDLHDDIVSSCRPRIFEHGR